jgi:hypothetical protein
MPNDDADDGTPSGLIKLKCPYCFNREFLADTAATANRRLDEHIERNHSSANETADKIYWTATDLKFLKGLRISPL